MWLAPFVLVLAGCAGASGLDATAGPDSGPLDGGRDAGNLSDAGTVDAAIADTGLPADSGAVEDAGGPVDAGLPPAPPPELVRYLTGADADADVTPAGPGLIMMGGSREVDAAFEWWRGPLNGGDVVVIRTSGSDGYNDYLFSQIGGVDSVETLLITTRALAEHPYVADRLRRAEGIFMAGGDQSTYVETWAGTALQDSLHAAWARGAVIGGTSAGLAVLGPLVFEAREGSITSETALADPYHPRVTLGSGLLDVPPLAGVLTDSHFGERDRMGRLVAFLARVMQDGLHFSPVGIGVNERTAVVVGPDGIGVVMGSGHVYVVRPTVAPEVCRMGDPLTFRDLQVQKLGAGDRLTFPDALSSAPTTALHAVTGALDPSDPY